eukprot:PhM_4_TR4180/c0_g1_i1/m.84525
MSVTSIPAHYYEKSAAAGEAVPENTHNLYFVVKADSAADAAQFLPPSSIAVADASTTCSAATQDNHSLTMLAPSESATTTTTTTTTTVTSDAQRVDDGHEEEAATMQAHDDDNVHTHDIAALLNNLCDATAPSTAAAAVDFFTLPGVDVAIDFYLAHFHRHTRTPRACYVLALVLLDRWMTATRCPVGYHNVHGVMLSALVVACKLQLETRMYPMSWYARVGGAADGCTLSRLERGFLQGLGYNLHVEAETFAAYEAFLTTSQ